MRSGPAMDGLRGAIKRHLKHFDVQHGLHRGYMHGFTKIFYASQGRETPCPAALINPQGCALHCLPSVKPSAYIPLPKALLPSECTPVYRQADCNPSCVRETATIFIHRSFVVGLDDCPCITISTHANRPARNGPCLCASVLCPAYHSARDPLARDGPGYGLF